MLCSQPRAMSIVSIRVLFFAQARELSGQSQAVLQVPEEITARDLLEAICGAFNLSLIRNSVILSVDEQFAADPDLLLTLRENTEVAVIPPISGG